MLWRNEVFITPESPLAHSQRLPWPLRDRCGLCRTRFAYRTQAMQLAGQLLVQCRRRLNTGANGLEPTCGLRLGISKLEKQTIVRPIPPVTPVGSNFRTRRKRSLRSSCQVLVTLWAASTSSRIPTKSCTRCHLIRAPAGCVLRSRPSATRTVDLRAKCRIVP